MLLFVTHAINGLRTTRKRSKVANRTTGARLYQTDIAGWY